MSWDSVNENLITREEAIVKIKDKAVSLGYATFKVFYDGEMIASPSDLPEVVDMDKIEIGQKADQA